MTYRKALLSVLCLFIFFQADASDKKIREAFDALKVYNYFKAKELFTKNLKKHESVSSYGLSSIFYNDKNPFHDLDSARIYALRSLEAYGASDEKEVLMMAEFSVDADTIRKLMNDIADKAYEAIEANYLVEELELYAENYNYSKWKNVALNLRDSLVFDEARSINSAAAYKEFIEFYPQARQRKEAEERYQQRLFEENASMTSIPSIEKFIKDYPDSPYLSQAQDRLYELFTKSGKLSTYQEFIEKYPKNPNIKECWRQIYEIETAYLSPEILMDFLLAYPDYPDKNLIKDELERLLALKIKARISQSWGFIDTSGNWIVRPIFDSCEPFSEGMSLVSKEDKFGFINARGEQIIMMEFDDAEQFKNGRAIVMLGDKYGAVDRFGNLKIPLEYESIGDFEQGLAYASKNDKYGYIDKNSFVLIPFIYDQAFSFESGRALVRKDGKYGVIDEKNKWVIPIEYDWIDPVFSDSLVKIRFGEKYGLIDLNNDVVIPTIYDQIGRIDQDLILLVKGKKVGYANRQGDIVIDFKYEADPFILDWGEFENGHARIRIKAKMGIIDSTDKRIVPAIFEKIGDMDANLFPIKKRGKWGYADSKIKLVVPYLYEEAERFIGDHARVKKNGKWGLINSSNESNTDFLYEKMDPQGGLYICRNDTAFGLMDFEGTMILDCVFDKIEYDPLDFYYLEYNGKYAYLDLKRPKVFWKEAGFKLPD